jgi:hypothetical protein
VRRLLVPLLGLCLLLGCREEATDAMSRNTLLIDQQFAAAYSGAAQDCLDASETREAYDQCMAPWGQGVDAVRALRHTTLTLDVPQGRRAFRSAACRWFEAVGVVEAVAPVTLPAVQTALDSRWRRRC